MTFKMIIFIFFILIIIDFTNGYAKIVKLNPGMPECTPPNNCSVHVFRVRLSQRPDNDDSDEHENSTIVSVVQKIKYGSNYYEIKGGNKITEEMQKEILQNLPEDTDPQLKEKITKKEFYFKLADGTSQTIPPMKITTPTRKPPTPSSTASSSKPNDDFPFLLVALLLCIGIITGILCTAICLLIAEFRKKPTFDRSNVVTYKKMPSNVENGIRDERRLMLRGRPPEHIEMVRQTASTPRSGSRASTIRTTGPSINAPNAPNWKPKTSSASWRQIST